MPESELLTDYLRKNAPIGGAPAREAVPTIEPIPAAKPDAVVSADSAGLLASEAAALEKLDALMILFADPVNLPAPPTPAPVRGSNAQAAHVRGTVGGGGTIHMKR